ncbi:restriction endonuclease subunit S [Staphylococcus aureus]|uniref:restriction endonuclease subunit S n=1 Tax=Staphylococcus aureus TaxID=1280 RepID=UPI00085BDB48|nr:restriction endonuclease subunit S [Staphylococcus aureus]UXU37140.1 restriction endonuclease subunit S [Staphylococcus aureus]SCU08157.1 type I restriction-modification system specificity protein [Staphylococcus aureus]SCU19600.1 type I restriction-modification system specificity protein [Staphylococcus aureus]SCU46027.1 type I restriction-modification system specificity protein [Staphylococcus aureus]SCU54229.1 type I restriction-modification system specificity protein [Staphylococcus aur
MSNTQKKNVPELRFPGFEGEWEEKQVGELLEFKNGLNKGKEYFGSGSSIVNFKDVFNNRSINTNNLTGKVNVNSKELKNYSVEKGDVFFTRTSEVIGEIGYPSVILNDPENTVFSGFVLRGRPKSGIDLINNNFKRYVFFTNSFRKEMITKSSMTTRALTSGTAINKMKVIYPVSAKEQKKIGDFFSKLDRQIELEEQKLELLQQQKKGYMQKIFTQELRFKDENGNDYPEWEETTIKEIAQINTGKKDTKDAITNGSYDFYVRSPIVYKINTFSYEGEAILTVGDGVGVGKVFHYVNGKFDYHQRVYKISDFKNYYGLLLFYYFSQNFLKETKKYSAKTSVDSVRKDMVANMKVPRPIYIEQEKIGQFIKKVDNKIKIQKQVIELLKQRKKALLQKMFI